MKNENTSKTLDRKEMNELIEKVRLKRTNWLPLPGTGEPPKIEDLAIIEMALITYESQERLNKLTKALVILTAFLIVLTAILALEVFVP